MSNHKNHYNFLSVLFPNQFSTIPSIIIWTLVFLVDVGLVFLVTWLLEIGIFADPDSIRFISSRLMLILYLLAAFGLFCLESFLYNLIKR